MDATDTSILELLQRQGDLSAAEVARRLALPATSVWRRIQALEEAGVIRQRVALVDPAKVGLGTVVFVLLRTNRHEPAWLEQFSRAVGQMPEILEAHRVTGDFDYMLKVVVADIAGYDAFYRRLIQRVPLHDVTASFSMERLKETTAVPLAKPKA